MTDFIEVYDNAMPADMCEKLINAFEQSPHRGAGRTGAGVDRSKKHSIDITLNSHADCQPMLQDILSVSYPFLKQYLSKYFFSLIGALSPTVIHPKTGKQVTLTPENWQDAGRPNLDSLVGFMYRYGTMNLQKYLAGVGGYPHWHSEIYPQDERCEPLHRVLLFMFYLNDVKKGGETEFFYQKKKIKPKAGRMVVAPAGFTHTHRGNIPESDDKYIATSWVMFHRAEQVFQNKPQ